MCLSIPAKVISIDGELAKVSISGVECDASIQLVDNIKIGDYVLLHAGFAIKILNEEEALETMKLIDELEQINRDLDNADNADIKLN
jgi:hydrogenase expression/formation protein HypC